MKKLLLSLFSILYTAIVFAQVPCENGFAGDYPCNNYDLMSHISLAALGASAGNDSWGWTDPADGKEYAIMGVDNGTCFIDISDPVNPVYLGKLPTHTNPSAWRDIKVYQNYAFVVSEASGHGMQVFDLTKLRNVTNAPATFAADAHYGGFGNCHNIVINPDQGFAYAVGTSLNNGGPHIVDIQNPLNPVFAGAYDASFYTHDAQVVTYNGPDTDYTGDQILIGSNEDEVVVVNVTNKSNPVLISTVSYSNIGYTHQGWFTDDQAYFLLGDELDEINFGFNSKTVVFDFTDLDNPSVAFDFFGQTTAIDHNGYVKNDDFFVAEYTAGMRMIDVSDIENSNIFETSYFDTYPNSDAVSFSGAWSVYPYFDSENIVISDIDSGFFLVRESGTLAAEDHEFSASVKLYPNPAHSILNIEIEQGELAQVEFFDVMGKKVLQASLDELASGQINVSNLSSAIYLARINNKISKKIIVE